uniref:PHD-type domain-containing protein n=1 Tax=Setaria italica TaxID=4555 RepID=K3Z0F2_SETIT
EELGSTFVCDACDRGFHSKCVRVWPPLLPPPPPPGPPGARRPRAAANEDWICPQCEMRGARSTRWKLGPVPLDINAAPPEEPVAASAHDISRHFLELLFTYIDMCLTLELLRGYE